MTTRRTFLLKVVPAVGAAALLGSRAFAAPAVKVTENDKMAMTLGYKSDTTKVDTKKYPKHTKDQACHNCTLFQGKPTDAFGGCTLFAGKQVANNGWCMSWAKKA